MLACEGPKRMPYPYGFVRQPSPCNIDRGSVPFDLEAMLNPDTREAELLRLWQADPIGSHPACVSPYGAYDMSGNVDEWTDNQGDDPTAIGVSTLNGGYWGPVRDTCRLTTRAHGPTFRFYQVGFRCCSDAIDVKRLVYANVLHWGRVHAGGPEAAPSNTTTRSSGSKRASHTSHRTTIYVSLHKSLQQNDPQI